MPLLLALGAGAGSRRILGTTVGGGMLAASVIGIFLIQAGFYLVESLASRSAPRQPAAK